MGAHPIGGTAAWGGRRHGRVARQWRRKLRDRPRAHGRRRIHGTVAFAASRPDPRCSATPELLGQW